MEKFIPELYNTVYEQLKPVVEKYNLDKITMESLIRSSIEIEEQELQPVTAIWKSKTGKAYSTKASNIKVSLKFALSSVFRLKTTFSQEDIWFGLAIIHLVVDLFTAATQEIDEVSAVVLIAVYRLQNADAERVEEYAKKIGRSQKNDLKKENIEEALKKLESWGCISCINGKFVINETVTASMIRDLY